MTLPPLRLARHALFAWAPLLCGTWFVSCSQDRVGAVATPAPTFDTDIAPILEQYCVQCHGDSSPAAGWSATTFLGAIACVNPGGVAATLPSNSSAPILSALTTAPHVGLLSGVDQATLRAWVTTGSPAFAGIVHDPGIIDPRSSSFHGTLLRASRWSQMLDPNDPSSCGRCHDGAPARPPGVTIAAPGAPSCTSCHDEPQGALACGTCHGNGARIYPPRDPCFFPGDSALATAHVAHVESSPARAAGFACGTCHPSPSTDAVISGLHGDGVVEVSFNPVTVGPEGNYNASTSVCAVTCHDSGGARPKPAWSETTPMGCNDCHSSPPVNHFPGSCTSCHQEANATGTALNGGPLHLDGRVELGNGSGKCGACHGTGDSPWPTTAAHPSHQNPTLTVPLACASCHVVPTSILDPTHLDGIVQVTFSGFAVARGSSPAWNGATCSGVACHGANMSDVPVVPNWTDTSGVAAVCGACHGIPPSQHTPSKSCSQFSCHGSEITIDASGVPTISEAGKALHINGVIDVAP